VRVSPEPRSEGLLLVGFGCVADHSFKDGRLSGLQPLERRTGELPRIPRMVGPDLRIAHIGGGDGADRQRQTKTTCFDGEIHRNLEALNSDMEPPAIHPRSQCYPRSFLRRNWYDSLETKLNNA